MFTMGAAYTYNAKFLRALDGDTFEFDVDLGFKVHGHEVVRLRGFFAPEMNEVGGPEAKAAAETHLRAAIRILIITSKTSTGRDIMSFTRYVADVFVDGELLALRLLRLGHVKSEGVS